MLEFNKIHNGDCLDLLFEVDDASIDLVILDPNYNEWDKLCEKGLICEAVRVLKPEGNILCFTKQPFDYELRNEVNHIFRRELTWTFSNGGAWVSNKMPLVSHQKIYWLSLNNKMFFNPRTGMEYEEGTKSGKRTNKVFEGYNEEGKDFIRSGEGTWLRDALYFNKPTGIKPYIPAKPLDLIKVLIKCFSPTDGIVLDPFIGSGTTCVATLELNVKDGSNRKYIGMEIEQKHIEHAIKRLG